MKILKLLCTLFAFFLSSSLWSQQPNLEKIIELHNTNLARMMQSRGVTNLSQKWDGSLKVTEEKMKSYLRSFNKEMAILLYTLIENPKKNPDSINLILLTKEGIIFNQSFPIEKDKLISRIEQLNDQHTNNLYASRGTNA